MQSTRRLAEATRNRVEPSQKMVECGPSWPSPAKSWTNIAQHRATPAQTWPEFGRFQPSAGRNQNEVWLGPARKWSKSARNIACRPETDREKGEREGEHGNSPCRRPLTPLVHARSVRPLAEPRGSERQMSLARSCAPVRLLITWAARAFRAHRRASSRVHGAPVARQDHQWAGFQEASQPPTHPPADPRHTPTP